MMNMNYLLRKLNSHLKFMLKQIAPLSSEVVQIGKIFKLTQADFLVVLAVS